MKTYEAKNKKAICKTRRVKRAEIKMMRPEAASKTVEQLCLSNHKAAVAKGNLMQLMRV